MDTQTTALAQVPSSGMLSASFDTGFFIGLELRDRAIPVGQGAPGILLSCLPIALVILPDFLCGCSGFNADTQICEASTLPIKPTPRSPTIIFI